MNTYAFLLKPSHNRVYSQVAPQLARAELLVMSETVLSGRVHEVGETWLGGVPYLTFQADPLTEDDLRYLAALSSMYALFEVTEASAGQLLRPVETPSPDRFGSDLITVQKYPGKTNEAFTRLLLNVTALACDAPQRLLSGGLRVLDPLCGRGTTLNQALMYGLDAAGVEQDTRSFEAYENFLRHWLKSSRIKHQATTATVRRDRRALGRRLHVTLGESKELYKQGQLIELTLINADTTASAEFFRPSTFDLIVTDAPYGARNGGRSRAGGGGRGTRQSGARPEDEAEANPRLSRSPLPLLRAALPVWARLLRTGGALGISWNTNVAEREELLALLSSEGFEVRDSEAYRGFGHRVDQAVTRDLVVARRVRRG